MRPSGIRAAASLPMGHPPSGRHVNYKEPGPHRARLVGCRGIGCRLSGIGAVTVCVAGIIRASREPALEEKGCQMCESGVCACWPRTQYHPPLSKNKHKILDSVGTISPLMVQSKRFVEGIVLRAQLSTLLSNIIRPTHTGRNHTVHYTALPQT